MTTRTLYEKRGRRYVPVLGEWYERNSDRMKVGTFRLTYCYSNGGHRYEYEVTPATAAWAAAATVARQAIEDEIVKAAVATPHTATIPYTRKQLAIIERYRAEMAATGAMLPQWWTHTSARDLSWVAVRAVQEFAP